MFFENALNFRELPTTD